MAQQIPWLRTPHGRPGSFAEVPFEHVTNRESLFAAWRALATEGGRGSGPDGVSPRDLGPREIGDVTRTLEAALQNGPYTPGQPRSVSIPKRSGGQRTLSISNVVDRVVAKAVQMALAPVWDRIFLPCSYGFRSGRGHIEMLADLVATMQTEGHWAVGTEDVRQAFDFLPIDEIVRLHRQHIQDERLLALIEVLLRVGRTEHPCIGIPQGNPYSPVCLNVVMHSALDQPIAVEGNPPPRYFRYADNLVYLGRDVPECRARIEQAQHLLKGVGLSLKGIDSPRNLLVGDKVEILGFQLSKRGDAVRIDMARTAWEDLEEDLQCAWKHPDPNRTAWETVRGWISAMIPALANVQEHSASRRQVLHKAQRAGFGEVIREQHLETALQSASKSWNHLLQRANHRLMGV